MKIKVTRPDGTVIEAEGPASAMKSLMKELGLAPSEPLAGFVQFGNPTLRLDNPPVWITSPFGPVVPNPAVPDRYIGDPLPGQETIIICKQGS